MSNYDTEELAVKINDGTATVEEIKAWMVQPCVNHMTMDAKAMKVLFALFDEQQAELDALAGVALTAVDVLPVGRAEIGTEDIPQDDWAIRYSAYEDAVNTAVAMGLIDREPVDIIEDDHAA